MNVKPIMVDVSIGATTVKVLTTALVMRGFI